MPGHNNQQSAPISSSSNIRSRTLFDRTNAASEGRVSQGNRGQTSKSGTSRLGIIPQPEDFLGDEHREMELDGTGLQAPQQYEAAPSELHAALDATVSEVKTHGKMVLVL